MYVAERKPATDEDLAGIAAQVSGDVRPHVFVAIPSYEHLTTIPENLNQMYKPNSSFLSIAVVAGDADIGQIRNRICEMGIQSKADYIVMLDDDVYPPIDGLQRLLQIVRDHDDDVIAVGSYHLRGSTSKTSVCSELHEGKIRPVREDGQLREAYYAAFGFAVIPTRVLTRIPQPWFVLGQTVSEDCYFSDRCREAGVRILIDSGMVCDHVDRKTGVSY